MNKYQMTKYNDTNDRIIIQEWFSKKGHHLTEGGYYDVDLEGKNFDIEISHLSFDSLWTQWKKENRFRIEIRKRNHYWNGIYNESHTTHFVQMNKSGHELLVYPQDLIMEYSNNEVELEYLRGFNLKERTFMSIPFNIGKDVIKRYEI
jgi:hypothetical protein